MNYLLFISAGTIILDVFQSEVLATMTSVTLHGVTDTLTGQYEQYSEALEEVSAAFREAEKLFTDKDFIERNGWFVDEQEGEDVVYAKDTPKGRMVTIQAELPMSPAEVMKETWNGMPTLPQWNKNIKYAKLIASPTSHFDIAMYGNNDVLIVSGRDFVSARIWRETSSNDFLMASRSVEIASYPKQKGKVRAHLHLAGARFRAHPTKPDTTLTDVVMLADLKGMLPKLAVNQILGKLMIDDTKRNREHFEDIKRKRDGQDN